VDDNQSWIGRSLPLIAATTKLATTLQRFAAALYERVKDEEAREQGLDFVEPMVTEFLEGLEELKASLPEKETMVLAIESLEDIVKEIAEHPTTVAVGAKVKQVVAERSDEVIGKMIEATFFSQKKGEPASKETVRVLGRIETLVDEAVARWLLPTQVESKSAGPRSYGPKPDEEAR
jgi:vacuolar-type H+-ATPase subunit E/Vma4